jgi:hypothetical protein
MATKKVIVLGGGVAGLTAAHELVERGFNVEVYERQVQCGGKARSITKDGSGASGRRDLPGEHGFRFFPGFYQHIPDTMRRIPYGTNANGVLDNLVRAPQAAIAQETKSLYTFLTHEPSTLDDWSLALKDLFDESKLNLRPGISEVRPYPAVAKTPNKEQRSQLLVLVDRVNETWVEGVLKKSLYNEVLISLGKRPMDEAVEPPWKQVVTFSSQRNQRLLQDRNITTIFDATGLLLILGEPGSGKTTTLLELAAILLGRVKTDAKERVPIVLNLSSWEKKRPLTEWIADELSEKYRVPRKIAQSWLQNDYLLPMLDGLDELSTAVQPDCVAAINAFIEKSNPSGLVVCCRLNEYRWLPERLQLNGAICIEPLSKDDVDRYLTSSGSKLAALREAVNTDPVLQELAQTPVMLSVMSLAAQGDGADELTGQKGNSPDERRKQVFQLYVEQMFKHKGTPSSKFSKEKTTGWLSWLALKMKEHSQSVFLVEGLQPSWLDSKAKHTTYRIVVALSLGLIFGLTGGLIFGLNLALSDERLLGGLVFGLNQGSALGLPSGVIGCLIGGLIFGLTGGLTVLVAVGLGCWWKSPLKNGVMSGSIFGLIGGMIGALSGRIGWALTWGLVYGLIGGLISGLGAGSLNQITSVENMRWDWNQFWKRAIFSSILGLIFGLTFRLIFGFGLNGLFPAMSWISPLIVGLIDAFIFGLVGGLVGGFTSTVDKGKASPNQGTKLSLVNGFAAFLITWPTVWLAAGLIFGLFFGLPSGLIDGLLTGLIAGLFAGFVGGGSAATKHYALRLILCLNGCTPFKFVEFLDHCANLILLKKVGGGYIFIHRMLLEYFAHLPTQAEFGSTRK